MSRCLICAAKLKPRRSHESRLCEKHYKQVYSQERLAELETRKQARMAAIKQMRRDGVSDGELADKIIAEHLGRERCCDNQVPVWTVVAGESMYLCGSCGGPISPARARQLSVK